MLVVRVAVRIKEEHVEEFESLARSMTHEVPARFEGCEWISVYNRLGYPTEFLIYEEWASEVAFAKFQGSEYFQSIAPKMGPMLAAPPETAQYDVTPRQIQRAV